MSAYIDLNSVGMGQSMLSGYEEGISDYLHDVDDRLDMLTLAVVKGDLGSLGYINSGVSGMNINDMSYRELKQLFDQLRDWQGGSMSSTANAFFTAMANFLDNNPNCDLGQITSWIMANVSWDGTNVPTGDVSALTLTGDDGSTFTWPPNGQGVPKSDFGNWSGEDGPCTGTEWGGMVSSGGMAWTGDNLVGIDPASTSGMFIVGQETDKLSKMASVVTKADKTAIEIAQNMARSIA